MEYMTNSYLFDSGTLSSYHKLEVNHVPLAVPHI